MTVPQFLAYLRRQGVEILVDGSRTRVRVAKGTLTPELRAEIAARREDVVEFFDGVAAADLAAPAGGVSGRPTVMSGGQLRLWLLHQLNPAGSEYHVPLVLRLRGRLDADALRTALTGVVARHEILRTRFETVGGEPAPVVVPPGPVALPVEDLPAAGPDGTPDRALAAVLAAELSKPFDLAAAPPLRARLLRTSDTEHVLAVMMHHIVFDNWSSVVFRRELALLYNAARRGDTAALPPLPCQYRDIAARQQQRLTDGTLAGQVRYWRKQLAGLGPLELGTDRPRPPVHSPAGGSVAVRVPAEIANGLRATGHRTGATMFMTLLAAFQAYLGIRTGQTDLAVGTAVAGRPGPEADGLIGFFVNTLVLRADMTGDPDFTELAGQVRATALAAYSHADLPFERLVELLQPHRDLTRHPLFQVFFTYTDGDGPPEPGLDGLTVSPITPPCISTKFDLSLSLAAGPAGTLLGDLQFSAALFDETTARRMAGELVATFADLAGDPGRRLSQLSVLPDEEYHLATTIWNHTGAPQPGGFLPGWVIEQAAKTPDAVAVMDAVPVARAQAAGDSHPGRPDALTYRQLSTRSAGLARHLRALGAGPETRVGVLLQRGPGLVIALLACWRAGAVPVPVDTRWPAERIRAILADAGAGFLLTHTALSQQAAPAGAVTVCLDDPPQQAATAALPPAGAGPHLHGPSAAYVMYTSGSSGSPKGVVVSHEALANFAAAMRDTLPLAARDVILAVTSPSFDIALLELVVPLTCGGRVVVAGQQAASEPRILAGLLGQYGVTFMQATPTLWRMMADSGWAGPPGLTVASGGEALPGDLAAVLAGLTSRQWNLYGPTETTIWSTAAPLGAAGPAQRPAIGRPIANTRVYVLDRQLRPRPLGVPGELYIGGLGVARGYHGRPDLTAQRFVADPFGPPGSRLYRTGDRVRWRADGQLDFLGRLDDQVKIRGVRVEPAEVTSVLLGHPAIADAAVVPQDTADGAGTRLAGYLVPARGTAVPQPRQLREWLAARLPGQYLPGAFVWLPALPLTSAGKLDRRALPAPVSTVPGLEPAAPQTPTQEMLAAIWGSVLGIDRVGPADDFFDLGGHSLLAARLSARITAAWDVELPLRALFEAPVLAGQAAMLEEALQQGPVPPVTPLPRGGTATASFAQERLWLLDQLEPGRSDYNLPMTLLLDGDLDQTALRQALTEVVARHQTLRSRFAGHDGAPAVTIGPAAAVPLPLTDLCTPSGPAAEDRRAAAERLAAEEAAVPFDLATGPLIRARLIRASAREHVLVIVVHHIVADEWSLIVLRRELAALYAGFRHGRRPSLPGLPVQYTDYAAWQRARVATEAGGDLAHWRARLSGLRPLQLPADRPRPPVRSAAGRTVTVTVPQPATARLRGLSRRCGTTMFMTVLAALQAVLSAYTGQTDIAVGTPVTSRGRPELEDLIGLFVNTLVLRTDLAGDPTTAELLGRVRQAALDAYSHQGLPFERLVADLQPDRDTARHPLFQVMLAYRVAAGPAGTGGPPDTGLEISPLPVYLTPALFDLTVMVDECADGRELAVRIEYDTALFERSTAARLARHLTRVLDEMAAGDDRHISQFSLLTDGERAALLAAGHGADLAARRCLLPEIIAAEAAARPDAPAVEAAGEHLSYAQLHGRATAVAQRLRELGAGPERVVAICLNRTVSLITAILGTLQAGAVYLLLDPEHPAARAAFQLTDSGACVLISERALAARLPPARAAQLWLDSLPSDDAGCLAAEPAATLRPGQAAYIGYTSGSTGTPKATVVTHGNLAAILTAWRQAHGIDERRHRWLSLASPAFDVFTGDWVRALGTGGTLLLAAPDTAASPGELATLLSREGVTALEASPMVLRPLAEHLADGTGGMGQVELLIIGSEPPTGPDLRQLRALLPPAARTLSAFGLTEVTVDSTYYPHGDGDLDSAGPLPIGRPLPGTRLQVVDPQFRLVPPGVLGELVLAGPGLSRGYAGRPDLTAQRFVASPFASDGSRLYRTGDLVRWRAGQTLEFHGRTDEQLRIRGHRIEPGEVEARLRTLPGVAAAAVAAHGEHLVGYLVAPSGRAAPDLAQLRAHLSAALPAAMIPSRLVSLDALPLTATGKLDRARLPPPGEQPPTGPRTAPATPAEEALRDIWADVLGHEVGVTDNFFAAGGHSLLAARVMARIGRAFGVSLGLRHIFDTPTIRQLAAVIEQTVLAEISQLSDDQVRQLLARDGGAEPPRKADGR